MLTYIRTYNYPVRCREDTIPVSQTTDKILIRFCSDDIKLVNDKISVNVGGSVDNGTTSVPILCIDVKRDEKIDISTCITKLMLSKFVRFFSSVDYKK